MVTRNKQQFKISLIVSDLSITGAGRWGGGGVRSFLLAQALQKLGYEVEILGFVYGEESTEIYQTNLSIHQIQGSYYPRFFQSAFNLIKNVDGDIIYAMRPKATTFGLSLIKKINTAQKLLLDIDDWELSWHGGEQWQYHPTVKQLFKDIFQSKGALRYPDHPLYLKWMEGMVEKADAITIHTQFLQKKFGGVYIPNGKDTNLFNPELYDPQASRVRYKLNEYRILMFPGAPRPYKGVEDVLIALEQLNQPDLRLVIVGGSPYDDYDSHLIEKWGRWIIKLDKYPSNMMPEIVAAAHIVVVPQRDTPAALAQFPLKITDGMAMAKPVLATKVGDIPEILGETGYLVDPASPEQIAEKIQFIFQNFEQAQELGKLARKRCIDYYSIDAMAALLSRVIQNL